VQHDETLDLSALAPVRPKARLRTEGNPDGTLYELAQPEDFGPVDLRELGNKYAEAETLLSSDEALTPAEDKRITTLTNELVGRLLIEAPAEDVAALPFSTKRALVMRFFVQLGDGMLERMGPLAMKLLPLLPEDSEE
jgi:hypothetical protein